MDIVERVEELFDRVLWRLTAATQQAARRARATSEITALEARLADLRTRLEQSVSEAGKLAFRQWKDGAADQCAALDDLCRSIDGMNHEYQRLLGELADLKAFAGVPAERTAVAGSSYQATLPPARAGVFSAGGTGRQGSSAGAPAASGTRFCHECLAEVPATQLYCPSCGIRME
jgi:hypothetical protein